MRPLAIDLFCGLGGWTDGLLATGYEVVGFDIERHAYGAHRYPAQLVLQDVTTLHGAQFRDAALIVASPPCQEFSYMAMPWARAKQIAAALRGPGEFPAGYTGSRNVADLTRLFDACFRIQREARAAAGRHIPLVVENVKGAQPWVGRARWNFGSFFLWGDVPALMPAAVRAGVKVPGLNWSSDDPAKRGCFRDSALKNGGGGSWFAVSHSNAPHRNARDALVADGIKQSGIGGRRSNSKGDARFQDGAARHGSKSAARKAASALIAKIPAELARHIGAVYAQREAP